MKISGMWRPTIPRQAAGFPRGLQHLDSLFCFSIGSYQVHVAYPECGRQLVERDHRRISSAPFQAADILLAKPGKNAPGSGPFSA
jgi:hypothetical protein